MGCSLLADLTLLIHGLFVIFVVCGGFAVLRRSRLAWLHLPSVLWGAATELRGWVCPLTPLENHFRRLAGEAGYEGSCIEHYLEPIIYPLGLTREVQVILGLGVLAVNASLYGVLWMRWRMRAP